ncbi:unnamed protein product [Microthlaspi erraticum]|uniref:Uncharacterized protein n=1 Tax=Microthlaspi erraticum TaxID=1685480 RepID=A0A6D2K3R5_9BRAS|nr:unnamed protein product [Microthlaspi erraticum]
MTLEQTSAEGTSLTEAPRVDRHASSAKFLSAQTAQSGWPRNECSALGQSHIRPSEFSAKVRNRPADHISRPGKHCPAVGQTTTSSRHAAHDHAARAGEQSLAAAQLTSRTTADASVRARKERPTSGRETIGQILVRPIVKSSGHDRSDSAQDPTVRPIVPTDCPNAAVDQRAQKKIHSMDFIKTSSLRAPIDLTFQRNWNGLIWMSRNGVITKRVKTAPDGSIENQRPNRADRLAEERTFHARPESHPSV